MPNQSQRLDCVYRALADPTRRAVLERLSRGPATTSELAKPYHMALPSFTQHLDVLEGCHLVASEKVGRVRTYRIAPQSLAIAESWIASQRKVWEARLNQMDDYVLRLKEQQHASLDTSPNEP